MRLSVALPGWILLGLAFSVTVASVWLVPTEPRGPIEATSRLQAESLGRDGDLVYDERDRLRFAAKGWTEREAKVLLHEDRGELRYLRPIPYAVALAPFARWAPERGPLVLNLVLLAGLLLALGAWLGRDGFANAPFWTLALVFTTPVFAYCRVAWPELWMAALLVGAFVLARGPLRTTGLRRRAGRGTASPSPDELLAEGPGMAVAGARFDAGRNTSPARGRMAGFLARWLGVGVLVALAVLHEPLLAVLLPGLLWLAPRGRAEIAWASGVAAFAFVLLAAWFLGAELFAGVFPGANQAGLEVRSADSIEDILGWTERLEATDESAFLTAPRLWAWNAVYTLAGRSVGALVAFAALLVMALTGRDRQGPLWLGLAAAALGAILLDPFNFYGGPEALSNRRLLPAMVLCFFAVRPSRRLWPALLGGALGALVVVPLWRDLGSHPMDLRAGAVTAALAERLPFETSQRHIPVSAEAVSRLVVIRPLGDGIEPGAGREQFVLRGGRRGELMVAAAEPLSYLDLEFGRGAGSELEVRGAEVENLLFRPDGGVTFRLAPHPARIRHRVWGREGIHDIHLLDLRMPEGFGEDQPFSVSAERSDS